MKLNANMVALPDCGEIRVMKIEQEVEETGLETRGKPGVAGAPVGVCRSQTSITFVRTSTIDLYLQKTNNAISWNK